MYKSLKKYVTKKVATNVVSKVVKFGFWTILAYFGPTTVISTIGIPAVATTGAIVYSGGIDFLVDAIIERNMSSSDINKENNEQQDIEMEVIKNDNPVYMSDMSYCENSDYYNQK